MANSPAVKAGSFGDRCNGASAAWLGLWALLAVGCGSSVREATSYSGEVIKPRVVPAEVRVLGALPQSAEVLGRASASCDVVREVQAEPLWLSDLDCSQARLTRALRERAANVGANALAELSCTQGERERECSAVVALLAAFPGAPALAANQASAEREVWLDEPQPHLAWRMAVRFTRLQAAPWRAPTQGAELQVVEHRSPAQTHVGDLRVSCEAECPRAALRQAAEVAASRLGAGVVAELRCSQLGKEQSCSAELGADETQSAPPNPSTR